MIGGQLPHQVTLRVVKHQNLMPVLDKILYVATEESLSAHSTGIIDPIALEKHILQNKLDEKEKKEKLKKEQETKTQQEPDLEGLDADAICSAFQELAAPSRNAQLCKIWPA